MFYRIAKEEKRREELLERAKTEAKERERMKRERENRRKMNVKNEKRRLDRRIARIDRGQWYKTTSPEKQVKVPKKITFEEFSATKLTKYSIVQLGKVLDDF